MPSSLFRLFSLKREFMRKKKSLFQSVIVDTHTTTYSTRRFGFLVCIFFCCHGTHTQGERRQVRTGSVALVMDELSTISIIAHSFWLCVCVCVYLKQLTCVFVCVCRVANKQLLSARKVKDIFFFFLFSLSFEKKKLLPV